MDNKAKLESLLLQKKHLEDKIEREDGYMYDAEFIAIRGEIKKIELAIESINQFIFSL